MEAENAVQGTHALHQIVTTREGVLRKQNLLCSCDMCCSQGTDVQDCANAGMVPEWSPEIQIRGLTLNPITRAEKLAKLTDDGEEAAANGSFAMNTLVSLPNPGGQPPFHILEVMGEPDVVDAAWVKAHGPVVSPVLSDEHGEPIVICMKARRSSLGTSISHYQRRVANGSNGTIPGHPKASSLLPSRNGTHFLKFCSLRVWSGITASQ